MAMQGLKASIVGALLGIVALVGSPSGAMAQSSNATVMSLYGVSQSQTLTPDQIAAKLVTILNQASGGGTAAVAQFVAALTATAGATAKPGDNTAANIMKALVHAALLNSSLSGAIAGGIQAGSAALTKAGIAIPNSITMSSNVAAGYAKGYGSAIVQTTVTVVQPSPSQSGPACAAGSCN